ncbi:MAG: hypothetical protein AAGF57_09635 [Pseudomonadota bacterium]
MCDSTEVVARVPWLGCPAGRSTVAIAPRQASAIKLQTQRRVFLDEIMAIAFR